MIIVTVVIW